MIVRTVAIGSLVVLMSAGGISQPAARPAFEVASIKLSPNPGAMIGWVVSGKRLALRTTEMMYVIEWAYHVEPWRISGGPGWLESERWDIEAVKPAASKAETYRDDPEFRQMAQALLEDRCKLRLHHVTKQGPVYELAVGKNGPKLGPPADSDDPNDYGAGGAGHGILAGTHASMADMAFALSGVLGRPVFDKTSLGGVFDFRLRYAPNDETDGPSIFTALQEQLGLRLSGAEGPVDTLVIDSIERPSAN